MFRTHLLSFGLALAASIGMASFAAQPAPPQKPSEQKASSEKPAGSKTGEADPAVPLPKSGKGDIREKAKIQDPVKAPPPGKPDPTAKAPAKVAPKPKIVNVFI